MKTAKHATQTIIVLIVGATLLVLLGFVSWANPGLSPASTNTLAALVFSQYPHGGAVINNIVSWDAHGWTRGAGYLVLLRPGAFLEVVIDVQATSTNATLSLTHRSGYAPGCQDSGYAPVSITVNGSAVTYSYVPSSSGLATNSWEIGRWLGRGANRIRITAGSLCSVYEIRRLEVSLHSIQRGPLEAVQMTHDISNNYVVDSVATFSPGDRQAVCWAKVTSEAIGQQIEWRFYDPTGNLYFAADRKANRYNWGYIGIANRRPSGLPGNWRVDIYIAGRFQVSVPFTIGTIGCSVNAPRVTGIEFPSVILADGGKITSYVSFFDPNGDITSVRFDVVNAVRFTPFSFDPNVSGKTNGSFSFRIWTTMKQTVTLKVTLYDRQGNKSEPYYFSFRAI